MWAFSFLLHFICLCFLGRCALVAERSRSVEHSFTEKSRISATLNDRDFSRPVAEHRLLSVAEASRSVLCHPFGIRHYCRVLPRAHTRVCVVFHPFRVDLIAAAAVVPEGRKPIGRGINP